MTSPRPLLVAGIGNIFFGDDAFGSEVARELMGRPLPEGVEVEDFGIRSYDLAYALMEGRDAILIDVAPRGEPPGTLYLIEPDVEALEREDAAPPDGHSMNPVSVLRMVRSLGGRTGRLFLVGCEPSVLECEEGRMGLSERVRAAVPQAIEMVESLIHDLLDGKLSPHPAVTGAAKEVS
jgi:hydrogenase maturation protease